MNLRKVKEIVKFDVEKSIQNKWFVILNIIMFLGVLLITNWSNISSYLEEKNIDIFIADEVIVEVLDNENLFDTNATTQKYEEYGNIKFEKVDSNNYSKENLPENNVILVELNTSEEDFIEAKIVSKEGVDGDIYDIICEELKEVRSKVFADRNNIELDDLNVLSEELVIERELLGVDAENSETKDVIKTFSIVIVYFVLILILSRIANEIAQEKTSKSIEYVLTSVTAKEYLLSKVLGVTISTLIQVLYTFVYYIIGNMINSLFVMQTAGADFTSSFANVDTSIISYVIVMAAYLIFTVFLTALIQATLSSKTTSVAEAGNTMMILMFVIIALYIISLSAISPYTVVTPFMYIISCLPLVSTFFVPSMMIIGQATTLQIIISFVVLIATVPAIFGVCAKHFKNGILDYTGSKKKNKKVKKEISLKEKQEKDLKNAVAKKFAFTIGMAFILLIFLQTVLSFIFGMILPGILNLDGQTLSIILNGIVSILSLGLTAGFINLYGNLDKSEPKQISSKKAFEYTFIGIGLIAIIQVALSYIYPKIGLDYDIFESFSVTPSGTFFSNMMYFVCIAIIPAIFEELLFRKAILNYAKKYGNAFAVLFSSVLFALFHMNINQGIFAFLIGLIFGTIAVKTSSIKLTVLLHFINNGFSAISSVLTGVSLGIFNNIVIAVAIFGVIIVIKNLPKLKDIKKEDLKIDKDCLLIFRNYTFVLSVILLVVMFVVTESMLQL